MAFLYSVIIRNCKLSLVSSQMHFGLTCGFDCLTEMKIELNHNMRWAKKTIWNYEVLIECAGERQSQQMQKEKKQQQSNKDHWNREKTIRIKSVAPKTQQQQ